MMGELALRISDALLALLWLLALIHTLRSGHLGPAGNHIPARRSRPLLYWFWVFILGLMALHFGGLAWVGQKL